MDGGGSAGGGGGPAPFLLKTYEMVDDASTDAIVSWSAKKNSFVVWNPPEFSRLLLPTYFKHNNFSSFIRQLNTYGFRKIDPERWEFSNDDFVKDQKHLLKNIYRRKPIHSHSQPQVSADTERAAFEEEIDKLTREKTALEGDLLSYKEQNSAAKAQLEDLTPKIALIEQRQERLSTFLEMAIQNPEFLERLASKLETMDFSADNKKRRVSQIEYDQPMPNQESVLIEDQSNSMSDFGNIPQLDFFNKLRLESTAVLSHSTQSSSEDGTSPQGGIGGWSKDTQANAIGCLPETLELSDTETSFTLKIDSSLPCKAVPESQKLHSFQRSAALDDECDGRISCLLNLTLAPSSPPSELNKSPSPVEVPLSNQEICTETRHNSDGNEIIQKDQERDKTPTKSGTGTNHPGVNDIFWEQFLTERPGCSDNEEASSSFRANPSDEREERKQSKAVSGNTKGMENLSL